MSGFAGGRVISFFIGGLVVAASTLPPAPAAAQGLAEAAARERKRREETAKQSGAASTPSLTVTNPGAASAPSPPGIGIDSDFITPALRQKLKLPPTLSGAVLTDIYPTGPAARAGLRKGDVVVAVDGHPIADDDEFGFALGGRVAGDSLVFSIWRAGATLSRTVTYAQRLTYVGTSCDAGNATACGDLATAYHEGRGVGVDMARSRALHVFACEHGFLRSCGYAGIMMEDGEGGPQDYPNALVVYKRACDQGELPACVNLGLMYVNGKGTPRDPERAKAVLLPACEGGVPRACTVLGLEERKSAGTPEDVTAAIARLQASCDAGDGVGCVKLADIVDRGMGPVHQDHARATVLYLKGCDCNISKGCAYAGISYALGSGVEKDLTRAHALYMKSCEGLGDKGSCTLAALQFLEGEGVAKDEARALVLLERACGAGDQNACGWARKVKAKS
jgi:uncharacterized protein